MEVEGADDRVLGFVLRLRRPFNLHAGAKSLEELERSQGQLPRGQGHPDRFWGTEGSGATGYSGFVWDESRDVGSDL